MLKNQMEKLSSQKIFDSEGYAFHTLKNYWTNDFQSLSTPDNKKKISKNQINIRIR